MYQRQIVSKKEYSKSRMQGCSVRIVITQDRFAPRLFQTPPFANLPPLIEDG